MQLGPLITAVSLVLATRSTACNGQITVQIGALRNSILGSSSTLHYLNGNCTWKIAINLGTFTIEAESVGPQLLLDNSGSINGYDIKCEVNNTVRLYAEVTVLDIVPAPNNIFLVNDAKLLQWSYLLQPSHLPRDFVLVHEFSITYIVYMKYYDRDGGVGAVTTVTVPGDRNYLILDTQDTCKRREFVIQAVINNELQSENRSVISNLNVPVFANLSASLQVEAGNILIIQVSFELLQTHCLSVFTIIIIETLRMFTFNVTNEDIENGRASFTLPPSMIDVCSVTSLICGGNDAGNSTKVDIQLPSECHSTYSTTTTAIVTSIATTSPTLPPPPNTDEPFRNVSTTIPVAVAVVGTVILIFVVIIFILILLIRKSREPRKRPAVSEDLPLKRNEAYATVSGVSMKRNEAYSVVVPSQRGVAYENVERPANTLDTQTSPEYETIH